MENKITKRNVIEMMMNEEVVKANELYVNYLAHELELLDKKSANRKSALTSDEGIALMNFALEYVAANPKATCSAVAKACDVSTQKMTPILKALVEQNKVVAEKDKKATVYTVA